MTMDRKVYLCWIDGDAAGVTSSLEKAKAYFAKNYKCSEEWHEAPARHPITHYEFCTHGLHTIEEYVIDRLAWEE